MNWAQTVQGRADPGGMHGGLWTSGEGPLSPFTGNLPRCEGRRRFGQSEAGGEARLGPLALGPWSWLFSFLGNLLARRARVANERAFLAPTCQDCFRSGLPRLGWGQGALACLIPETRAAGEAVERTAQFLKMLTEVGGQIPGTLPSPTLTVTMHGFHFISFLNMCLFERQSCKAGRGQKKREGEREVFHPLLHSANGFNGPS